MFILWVPIFGSVFLLQILRNINYTAEYSVNCLTKTFELIYTITSLTLYSSTTNETIYFSNILSSIYSNK